MAHLLEAFFRTIRPFGIIKNLVRKPMTLKFPYESLPQVEGYRGRHSLNLETCRGCFICSMVCPNKAIWPVEFKARTYPQVHLGKCCFCQLCEEYCPSGAIKLTPHSMIVTMDQKSALLAVGDEGFIPKHG